MHELARSSMSSFKNNRIGEILSDFLCGSLESNTHRLLHYLKTPPHYSSLRVNTLVANIDDVCSEIEGYLSQLYEVRLLSPPVLYKHPLFSDVLLLKSASEGNPSLVIPAETSIIVGLGCGLAIMRGADVYSPGILGAPLGLRVGQLVAVYADLQSLCLRGLTKPFEGPTVFVGNGLSLISRDAIFKTATPKGLAIQITDRVHDLPSLGSLMPNILFLQNLPSVICGHVLNPKPGDLVLDMCAAPGGKTTHLATLLQNQGRVIALDRSQSKTQQIRANAERLDLTNVTVFAYDSTKAVKTTENLEAIHMSDLAPPFAPATFDKILLDAPCSALGQRPQLLNPITLKELQSYPKLQKKLFAVAIELLKPEGKLVYSTCTLMPAENEGIVAWALQHFPGLELIPAFPNPACQCNRPYPIFSRDLTPEQCRNLLRFHPKFDTDPIDSQCCEFCLDRDSIGFFISAFIKH